MAFQNSKNLTIKCQMCLILVLGVFSVVTCDYTRCVDDGDCHPGTFCYLRSRYCATCVNCTFYGRTVVTKCAKSQLECGGCLPGRSVPQGLSDCVVVPTTQKPGTPARVTPAPAAYSGWEIAMMVGVLLLILTVFVVLFLWLWKKFFKKRLNSAANTAQDDSCRQHILPPPYGAAVTNFNPSAPTIEAICIPADSQGFQYCKKEEFNVKAIPIDGYDIPDENDLVDGAYAFGNNTPGQHDDDDTTAESGLEQGSETQSLAEDSAQLPTSRRTVQTPDSGTSSSTSRTDTPVQPTSDRRHHRRDNGNVLNSVANALENLAPSEHSRHENTDTSGDEPHHIFVTAQMHGAIQFGIRYSNGRE